ncbi:MAG: ATP-binding cassette domain-containing protein [Syntrophobacteraceae bacterium]|nr:ATP-binding cassette domain-containing protein [Syntrophobacteraceae bacterium]
MIRIRDFHKRFHAGSINEVYPLRGINLHVRPGDFVTVIGTNGSGKSTLLNAIAGAFPPDSGTIEIDGEDVSGKKDFQRAKHIARVFQNPFVGTAPEMSIAENLHMAHLRGKKKLLRLGLGLEQRERLREEVRQLEMQMENRLENMMGTLSGGQRQAITLLMAVVAGPKVLLLDEHTAALDPKSAAQVIALTKRFVQNGGFTTLMVTHSMQQALELGNRTIMMHQGQIIEDISSEEKRRCTVEDLLDKFSELRKKERLTAEMLERLRRSY